MIDFLLFIENLVTRYPVHVEISYSKVCDWIVHIWKAGVDDICCIQDSDMELAFAKAHVALKEWLLEHEGGY
jgi:hypothetical protein